MRFVLNTRSDTAGAQASIFALASRLRAAGVEATLGDWDNYDRYDVAIFMAYDHQMPAARTLRFASGSPTRSNPGRSGSTPPASPTSSS